MSFYDEVLQEINKIDHYLRQGFTVTAVKEDLSGALAEFTSPDKGDQVTLHILTAEARIHLSNRILKQLQRA
jgi:hypothetical protein